MQSFDLPGKRLAPDAIQFSPDNRRLAVQSFGRVDVLDTVTGEVRIVADESFGGKVGTAGIGFTADGRGVVYFRYKDHTIRVFDLESGTDRVIRAGKPVPWSPRGDMDVATVQLDGRVAFAAVEPEAGTVEIIAHDTATGEQLFTFARHRKYIRELAVSPCGQWVAACSTKDLRVWSLVGGNRPSRAAWHVKDLQVSCFGNMALARDGAYLAQGGYSGQGNVRVWDIKAGAEQQLSDERLYGGGAAFAADRPLLAYTQTREKSGHVVFWDAAAKAQLNRFDWGTTELKAVTFSPDGCRCATADATRAVVWDVDV